MADPHRKGGAGLSLRTLSIASAASLTAAMVTSRLFPPGTIYASALTPVIVAAVSEMLNRPANRVAQLRAQRRTLVLHSRTLEEARVMGEGDFPLAGAPDFAQGADADAVPNGNGNGNGSGHTPRISYHGRRRGLRRVFHPKVWIATGLVAFLIAAAALTLPELIFGGAVVSNHRTTFFGGGGTSSTHTTTTPTQTQTTPTTTGGTKAPTSTDTTPAQTPPSQTQTQTSPAPSPANPSGGAPAPSGTGTSTTPVPSGAGTP